MGWLRICEFLLFSTVLSACVNPESSPSSSCGVECESPLPDNWYVAPNGSAQNTGTLSSPWSLAYAASCAGGQIGPGDRVHLRGGVYSGSYTVTCSGSPGLPITYRAYDGGTIPEYPVIDSSLTNLTWEPYGALVPGHNVYRTTSAVPSAELYSGFVQIGSQWVSLIVHGHYGIGDAVDYLTSDVHLYHAPKTTGIATLQSVAGGGTAVIDGDYAPTPGTASFPGAAYIRGQWTGASILTITGTDASGQAISEVSPTPATTYTSSKRFKTVTGLSFGSAVTNMTFGTYAVLRYVGPGLAFNTADQRIYIRLDNSPATAQLNRPVLQIAQSDPNANTLRIANWDSIGLKVIGSHIVVEGLEIANAGQGINTSKDLIPGSVTDVTFKHLDVSAGIYGARLGFAQHVRFEGCRFHARMPSSGFSMSYTDVKVGDVPAGNTRKAAIDMGGAAYVDIVNNEFDEFVDGLLGGGHHINVTNNIFRQIWDDAWQMPYRLYQVDVGYNQFLGAGVSRDGTTASPLNPNAGTIYIHHNIFDAGGSAQQHQVWWHRGGVVPDAPPDFNGMADGIPLSSHSTPAHSFPLKLYYNTFIVREPKDPRIHAGTGIGAIGHLGNQGVYSGSPHEVYNNIFYDVGGVGPDPDVFVMGHNNNGTLEGREMYDGNVYAGWTSPSTGVLFKFVITTNPTQLVADWLFTPEQMRDEIGSLITYPIPSFQSGPSPLANGWEYNGFSAPELEFDGYVPTNCQSVLNPSMTCETGAVSLVESGWPGTTTYEPWRGAVQPHAPPSDVTATAISSSRIRLTWSPVVAATKYYVYQSISGGPFAYKTTKIASMGTQTLDIAHLTPSTTYGYQIQADTPTGLSPMSQTATATTLP